MNELSEMASENQPPCRTRVSLAHLGSRDREGRVAITKKKKSFFLKKSPKWHVLCQEKLVL